MLGPPGRVQDGVRRRILVEAAERLLGVLFAGSELGPDPRDDNRHQLGLLVARRDCFGPPSVLRRERTWVTWRRRFRDMFVTKGARNRTAVVARERRGCVNVTAAEGRLSTRVAERNQGDIRRTKTSSAKRRAPRRGASRRRRETRSGTPSTPSAGGRPRRPSRGRAEARLTGGDERWWPCAPGARLASRAPGRTGQPGGRAPAFAAAACRPLRSPRPARR
jgi:hypothetical protein